MNAAFLAIVLTGSVWASAAQVTGRELALLRVILRQSMSADQHAAYESGDALMKDRTSPLGLVSNDPNTDALHGIMTDEANDPYKRLSAARVMAYFGDTRCIDLLVKTLAGEFAPSSSGFAQSEAGACLLYLGYDFPKDFLFTRLPNALYPELNALLEDPEQPTEPPYPLYSERYNLARDPNLPYADKEISTQIMRELPRMEPVKIRGPLSVADVMQREVQRSLDEIVSFGMSPWLRIPSAGFYDDWQAFTSQMEAGDLIYYFTTDEMDWSLLGGREGYVLIHEGRIVTMLITILN